MPTLSIPISKAKRAIEVDTDDLDPALMTEALVEGLKVILNAKMTKIKTKDASEEDTPALQQAAYDQARTNLADFKAGKRKVRAASADGTKLDAKTKTEAMRIARNMIKDTLKANKVPIREVPAATITAGAAKLLEANPSIIEQARANLAARPQADAAISLSNLGVSVDPKLTAKFAAEKAQAKASLSATQAGKVKPRRATTQATAH